MSDVCAFPLIDLQAVSLSFGDQMVLRQASASLIDIPDRGQVYSLIGPSGVGKSTFAKVLAGLYTPSSGQVLVCENDKQVPVRSGMVGFVTQSYMLFEHMTVWDNLMLAAKKKNGLTQKEQTEKVSSYLQEFGLYEHRKKYPTLQLSGGQQQRVAILQQLLCSEHYIVMDEPFSGLDLANKDVVRELIIKVANLHAHNSIIIITHDLTEAMRISDTLWFLGRDHDEAGAAIPGAYIKATMDLHTQFPVSSQREVDTPEFLATLRQVEKLCRQL